LSCEQAKADLKRGGQGTGSYVDAALPVRLWSNRWPFNKSRLTTLGDNAKGADLMRHPHQGNRPLGPPLSPSRRSQYSPRQPFFFVKTAAIRCERATHWLVSGG